MMKKIYRHGISVVVLAVFVFLALGSATLTPKQRKETYARADEYTRTGDSYAEQGQYEQALEEYQKSFAELSTLDFFWNKVPDTEVRKQAFTARKNAVQQRINNVQLNQRRANAPSAPSTAAAAPVDEPPVTEDDFQIVQNAQSGITITGYTGKATRVVIPATISGLPVTEIGNGAFHRNNKTTRLTAVTIPNGVQIIGDEAFAAEESYRGGKANSLPNVVIPDSVTSIGKSAFANCDIKTLTLGNSLTTIGWYAFSRNAFEELTIPDSVTRIEEDAFSTCGIKTLKLGKGITTIEAAAFARNQISEITLGNKLVTIGIQAFEGNQLRELTLPASLKTILNKAFSNNQLTTLVIPNGVTLIGSDAFNVRAGAGTVYGGAFSGNPLTNLTIPASLASYSDKIATARMGERYTVRTMGFADGFKNCPFTRITLPTNVAEENVQQFGDGFVNFWKLQNKRAGTYVLNNRIWTVQ